jgi:hypothetical protein
LELPEEPELPLEPEELVEELFDELELLIELLEDVALPLEPEEFEEVLLDELELLEEELLLDEFVLELESQGQQAILVQPFPAPLQTSSKQTSTVVCPGAHTLSITSDPPPSQQPAPDHTLSYQALPQLPPLGKHLLVNLLLQSAPVVTS